MRVIWPTSHVGASGAARISACGKRLPRRWAVGLAAGEVGAQKIRSVAQDAVNQGAMFALHAFPAHSPANRRSEAFRDSSNAELAGR